jgi:hypothetical protein
MVSRVLLHAAREILVLGSFHVEGDALPERVSSNHGGKISVSGSFGRDAFYRSVVCAGNLETLS